MQTEGNIEDIYTLNPMQEGILFHALLEENTFTYFEQMSFRLSGTLDIPLFKKSLNMLFQRHDVLRTAFIYENTKRPVQVVLKKREAGFLYEDKRNIAAKEEKEQWVKAFKGMDKQRSFDLTRDPLLRLAVLQLEEKEYEVTWSFHHILMDGWSTGILISEFFEVYNSLLEKRDFRLAEPIPYRIYIRWLEEQDKEKSKHYWKNYLEGYGEKTVIPGQKAFKTHEKGYKNERLSISLDQVKINQLAARNQVSLNTFIQTVWGILLAKYNRERDVVFGAVVSGRPPHIEGGEAMVGLFINTIPVRIHYEKKTAFNRLLKQVQQKAVDSEPYHYYPLADIQAESLLKQDLIDHILVFENYPIADRIEGIMAESNIVNRGAQFNVTNVDVFEQTNYDFGVRIIPGNPLTIEFEYNGNAYDREFIERAARHFNRLIHQVLNNEEIYIDQLSLLSEAESKQVLEDFNQTCREYPVDKTLHRLFEEQVDRTPDRMAVVGVPHHSTYRTYITYMTYKTLNEKSRRLACLLGEKGVKPDTIVGLMSGRSIEMIAGIMGILKAGGAYLPIDPDYPEERVNYMLKDSGARILLTNLSEERHFNCQLSMIGKALPATTISNSQPATSLAYVIYTSGTTGKPKGALLTHRNLVNYVHWFSRMTRLTPEDTALLTSSFAFDLGYTSIYPSLLTGACVHIIPKETYLDAHRLLNYISRNRVTYLKVTPSLFSILVLSPGFSTETCRHLRLVVMGGESINPEDLEKAHRLCRHIEIINHYGPTEATIGCIAQFVPFDRFGLYKENPTIGKPIYNTCVYILGKDLNLLPVGVPGELFISGTCLARGYLNSPDLTNSKFQIPNSPTHSLNHSTIYRTGDRARWFTDGSIEFLGRIDEQVKIRGFRIELAEIEYHLANHREIKEVVVFARKNQKGNKNLCAYLVSNNELPVSELREYLLTHLPEYMVPLFFVFLEKIPLTPNGKIDKKALPNPEIKAGDYGAYVSPRNETEEKLVNIWSEILSNAPISIDDNFFLLGGHSLTATIMMSKIHKEFKVKLPLAEIFKAQTIRRLSVLIEQAEENEYADIEPVEEKEHYPLSSAQKRLYFLQQMDLNSTSYNIPLLLPLGKDIEQNKFESTLTKLIERHESLRTSFEMENELPVQRIHKPHDVRFGIEYFSTEAGGTLPATFIKRFVRPFDLSQAPLIRSCLIKSTDNNHIWVVDIHHIVSDGTSRTILADDFLTLYRGEELEPLRLQYKDFSKWQNNLFEAGRIKGQEEYWLKIYDDTREIPRLNLPNDHPRPDVFTFKGADYTFLLEAETAVKFKSLGSDNGATLFMNILAALNTLFYKYTGQTDIVIGTGIAGRPHADLQRIIGMFVNTLAMRNHPHGEKTYESFLKEVIDHCIDAFDNQDVQFEELVDQLAPERDPSRNPLFDISLVVQNFRRVGEGVSSSTGKNAGQVEVLPLVQSNLPDADVDYKNPTSKVDMTFFVHDTGEDVQMTVEYYTDVFKEETVKRFVSHFKNIIETVIREPSTKLNDIEMISLKEKEKILHQFNDTRRDYPGEKTIHQLFEDQVEKTPANIAVICRNEQLTYSRLEALSNRLAGYLHRSKGIKLGDRVGILLDGGIDTVVAILGILKAGGAYVPIEPSIPVERKKHMIKDCSMGILVAGKKYLWDLNRLQWECDCLHTYLCIDSQNVYAEKEGDEDEWMKMNRELWEHVGETAVDDITAGGWLSSYTGEPFSKEEMDQYGDNILKKLEPLLHKNMRVLEIGAASGISMYRLAPKVGLYYGTDLSPVIIEKNRQKIEKENISNIKLRCLPAHEIDRVEEKNFDLIVMNSVIQAFQGHNYLRKVIKKASQLLGERGYLFIGDIMDQDKKDAMIRELSDFKYASTNNDKNYTTKTDFSSELFISRGFFKDIESELEEIERVEFSDKIYTIKNELTRFRYDTLMTINKQPRSGINKNGKTKNQEDQRALRPFGSKAFHLSVSSGSLAYIIYTSGTTGVPKGVGVEHTGVVNTLLHRKEEYGMNPGFVQLQLFSYSFDGFVAGFFTPIISGSKVVLINKEEMGDIEKLRDTVVKNGVTHFICIPSLYNLLIESLTPGELSTLKAVTLAGEKVSLNLLESTIEKSDTIEIINEYGVTESSVMSTIYRHQERDRTIKIGHPIGNTRLYILDKTLQLRPIGIPGELCIAGDGLARGYLNNPELTEEKFTKPGGVSRTLLEEKEEKGTGQKKQSLYKTGDLARWLPDGNVEFLGRIDHQVKIRGFRIELGEIESRLLKHDWVKDAVVIDRVPANSEDKYLCAYIVSQPAGAADELSDYLSKELPGYMIPTYFFEVDSIPVTSSGKVDRKNLPAPQAADGDNETRTAPRDTVEKTLAVIWGEVLNISPAAVGIDDNFFRLGGHSLKATVLAAKIHKNLNVKLPLAEVFKTPTIRELAAYIMETAQEQYASIEPAEKKEYYPLSSVQKRMYIAQQMEIDGISYNMPNVMGLKGPLDVERLTNTFKQLIKKHESLRTSIIMLEDGPVQKIHQNAAFEIVSHTGTVNSFIRPFDLSQPPLMRVGLTKTGETAHLLIVDMHHIITDAVSRETLAKDFIALYNGNRLSALNLQYKDFSEWQNRLIRSGEIDKQGEYWLNKFKGDIPVLNMPTDYRRPSKRRIDEGDHIEFLLDIPLTEKVFHIMEKTDTTLYMVLSAVYNILLFKYTKNEDIVVGTPIAGRRHADLQHVIGVFLNMLAMRNFPGGDKTFARFLEEVKKDALEAYENQDYQFEELVMALGLQGETARNPLFDTEFAVIKVDSQPTPGAGIHGLTVEPLPNEHRFAKFDLHFQAIESGGTIYMTVRYSTELFKRSTIKKIKEYYIEILQQVVENINIKLRDISVSHRRLIVKSSVPRDEDNDFLL